MLNLNCIKRLIWAQGHREIKCTWGSMLELTTLQRIFTMGLIILQVQWVAPSFLKDPSSCRIVIRCLIISFSVGVHTDYISLTLICRDCSLKIPFHRLLAARSLTQPYAKHYNWRVFLKYTRDKTASFNFNACACVRFLHSFSLI